MIEYNSSLDGMLVVNSPQFSQYNSGAIIRCNNGYSIGVYLAFLRTLCFDFISRHSILFLNVDERVRNQIY